MMMRLSSIVFILLILLEVPAFSDEKELSTHSLRYYISIKICNKDYTKCSKLTESEDHVFHLKDEFHFLFEHKIDDDTIPVQIAVGKSRYCLNAQISAYLPNLFGKDSELKGRTNGCSGEDLLEVVELFRFPISGERILDFVMSHHITRIEH